MLVASSVGCGSGEAGKEYSATLSIDCTTILSNADMLKEGKQRAVPPDGIIMASTKVLFHEGESAFDVLKRETMNNKIHLEFSLTPVHNSAYIEGIGNIYEFDCGQLSGWSYLVNGTSMKESSSDYELKDGDIIEWRYSCNLGKDVGDKTLEGS